MTGDVEDRESRAASIRIGAALATADGQYLDADPVALDLYGVTLDVLRQKRIGDFSPPEYAELERQLWSLWVHSGLENAEGGGTVVGSEGRHCRTWVRLTRRPDRNVEISLQPVDEPAKQAPSIRVQNVLGQWRELERHLADLAGGDPARPQLLARIEALREEYQRRTNG